MIKTINGDILNATEDIICHQVNCQGVMGSGLAKQIKQKYYEAYEKYKEYCERERNLLGNVCVAACKDGKIIFHLFGQDKYGTNKRHTNYEALDKALVNALHLAKSHGKTIALPYNLGCGLAGGDWDIVYGMIERVFEDYGVTLYKK